MSAARGSQETARRQPGDGARPRGGQAEDGIVDEFYAAMEAVPAASSWRMLLVTMVVTVALLASALAALGRSVPELRREPGLPGGAGWGRNVTLQEGSLAVREVAAVPEGCSIRTLDQAQDKPACRAACRRDRSCSGFSFKPGLCANRTAETGCLLLLSPICLSNPDPCWDVERSGQALAGEWSLLGFFAAFMMVKLLIIVYLTKFLFCMPALGEALEGHGNFDVQAYQQKVPLCKMSELHGPDVEEANCVCAVCLEPLELEPEALIRKLPCRHMFHAECVDPWVEAHCTCPTCRMDPLSQQQRRSHTPGDEGWRLRWARFGLQ